MQRMWPGNWARLDSLRIAAIKFHHDSELREWEKPQNFHYPCILQYLLNFFLSEYIGIAAY